MSLQSLCPTHLKPSSLHKMPAWSHLLWGNALIYEFVQFIHKSLEDAAIIPENFN